MFRAGDGVDALRILSSQRCDVVVCDELMPNLGGSQRVDELRESGRLARSPVIMIDAFARSRAPVVEGTTILAKR